MPFTFSHPAAIFPMVGNKRYFSASGLIVGSMVPDFENFLRMDLDGSVSDTFLGIFIFDLPLSILLLFLYHLYVRDIFISSLPKFLSQRFATYIGFDWMGCFKNRWKIILPSIFIGVLTHLFWDSFTHYDSWLSLNFRSFFYFKIGGISLFNVFQHASSLVGGVLVFVYIGKMEKGNLPNILGFKKQYYWLLVFLFGGIVFICRALFGFDRFDEAIVSAISSVLWGILLGSFLYVKYKKSSLFSGKKTA